MEDGANFDNARGKKNKPWFDRRLREIAREGIKMSIMENDNAAGKEPAFIGQGVRFERIRRITGYLVGTLDRWNNAKRAEERDRVKHVSGGDVGAAR